MRCEFLFGFLVIPDSPVFLRLWLKRCWLVTRLCSNRSIKIKCLEEGKPLSNLNYIISGFSIVVVVLPVP